MSISIEKSITKLIGESMTCQRDKVKIGQMSSREDTIYARFGE